MLYLLDHTANIQMEALRTLKASAREPRKRSSAVFQLMTFQIF